MHKLAPEAASGCQENFHRRWNHLVDQHVPALIWLLDALTCLMPLLCRKGNAISLHMSLLIWLCGWLNSIKRPLN